MEAYREAKRYVSTCLESMVPNIEVELGFGTFAASIALERLPVSFLAAHLLYRIGLHHEGDAVARQILEQVAWAIAASELTNEADVEKLKTRKRVRDLQKLVPYAGPLYGDLSRTTHASLPEHRKAFTTHDGRAFILHTRSRASASALRILLLADIWVVAYEWTQREHMTSFRALDPHNDYRPRRDRAFISLVEEIVREVADAEDGSA